jgi:ribosomal protein S18 acetylase RimI-like enzyme
MDAWLSAVLQKPAFHLTGTGFSAPVGAAFVDTKVPVEDVAALPTLQSRGFQVVDTNVQLARSAGTLKEDVSCVRPAKPDDAAAVRALAGAAFVWDRFHRDPQIDSQAASRLKAEWAGNYFVGKRGDRMVVAEDQEGLCGFLQLITTEQDIVIDLIAVDARCRGKGVARSMIALAAKGGKAMRVGTQIANLPSLALYEGLGFRVVGASYVLHLHLPGQS